MSRFLKEPTINGEGTIKYLPNAIEVVAIVIIVIIANI